MKSWAWAIATLIFFAALSCGKPESAPEPEPTLIDDGTRPVAGTAQFGSQCPFGSLVAPQPVPIQLEECPIPIEQIELNEPLPALVLQGDCKTKTVTIRSFGDRRIDLGWETMPDGTFGLTMDAGVTNIKDDGSGNQNCQATLTAQMSAKLICPADDRERDKADIELDTSWWINRPSPTPSASVTVIPTITPTASATPIHSVTPTPTPSPTITVSSRPTPTPTVTRVVPPFFLNANAVSASQTRCVMPPSCFFRAKATIKQCQ